MEKRLTADLNVVANSNLEIQLLDGDLNIIQKLDDEPNDVGGLTSAELKAKFDESGNIIKKYINETLIPAVLTDDATEESRKQAEAARVAAEQGRVTAEEGRVSAETARAAAEQARSEAEASRVSAENAREAAETARADETAGIVARATEQANAAAGSASQAAGSEQSAKDAAGTATGAASSASQSAVSASGSASQASAAAAAAAGSAAGAETASKTAQSWAVGGTGTRPGEDTDNAEYWARQAQAAVGGDFATKTEAQGYVTTHNESADAHADIRDALDLKQDKLKGTAGQFVGFDASGSAVAVAAPNSLYLDSIAVATPPDKLDYKAGEVFNTAGMVVKANYTNGTVIIAKDIVVTGWAVDPSGALEAGRDSVTVQYTENGVTKTAEQAVTVTKTELAVPTQSGTLTYTGGELSPEWNNYDAEKMELGGVTSGTNAGSYNATFTLKDIALYCWPDGSTAPQTVEWEISKAAGTLTLSKISVTLKPDTVSDTLTVTTNSTGAVTAESSATDVVSVKASGKTVTVESVGNKSGTAVITVSVAGDDNHTAPASKTCSVKCSFVSIYGVQWDGTATTLWSRTDDAAGFVNPSPAVNNGTGSSPFDGKMPWAGMVVEDDPTAGKLVKIPKFWYKWTRSGKNMKLQIAGAAVDGFHTSPAHADRGDGKGERDYVYIGRYHCISGYESQASGTPKTGMTRAVARDNIHNLGATYWQYDFAMYWTIMMLYLVEFADWNSQKTIGYGCAPGSYAFKTGATDTMKYHTGTTAVGRAYYGCVQYRYIEGLWDNVFDWCDGIYFAGALNAKVFCIKNPAKFSDTNNGTLVGIRATGANYISEWTNPTDSGFEYALYPNAINGTENTYVCDYCDWGSSGVVVFVGGNYGDRDQRFGAFYLNGSTSAAAVSVSIGCRLQKLP